MTPFVLLSTLSLLGYHLTFDAEMTSPTDMSQFINTYSNGNTTLWTNDEAENYVAYGTITPITQGFPAPFTLSGGALAITASPVTSNNLPYTSGMLNTFGIFNQTSGYFEVRASMPSVAGFWPAFWLLPSASYPEIDILEQPNNSGSSSEYWTHISTPTDSSGGFTDTGTNVFQGYHTYGFLWTASTIQFVFDGNLVGWPHALPPSMVGLPMYMIANLAVGGAGSWPGVPATGAVSNYNIDYIRAFSNDPTVPAVQQQAISSPDGANTTPQLQPPTPLVPAVIGKGANTLVLQIAEDAYEGVDAQFTISVDGKQQGGVQTTTANHAYGQTQAFTVKGNFTEAQHTVTVNFLNDASGSDGDRNLYLTGATYNGFKIYNVGLNEYASGPQSFNFTGKPERPFTIGTGPDSFVFNVSEDKFTVNAVYSIAIDGVQQGKLEIASATHADGQTQNIIVNGAFGPSAHKVQVKFYNGAKTAGTTVPANLYIDGLSYDGIPVPNSETSVLQDGTIAISTPPLQADTLTLNMTEDAYLGDAQAQISIDGVPLGSPVAVTAPNSGATPQALTFSGSWGGSANPHVVTVNYLNDTYAGPGQDRNLHVQSIVLDNVTITNGPANLMIGGPVTFNYAAPPLPGGWAAVAKAK